MKRTLGTWLLAACAAAAGCSGSPATQVLTGNVTTTGAVAVRAIANGNVVTASRVRSDGSFTLALPAGARYRLEVLSSSGVVRVVDHAAADITFSVCAPTDPFDMGTVGAGGGPGCDPAGNCPPPCDPNTDANCKPPPPPCDPNTDANCPPPCDPATNTNCPPPPPCDPATNTNCPPPPPCDPATNTNCPPPPPCDPAGNCPPPCDPNTDPGCKPPPPPPCDPATDANCPPPPCDPATDANCPPPCDPATGNCKPPPPPPCDPAADGSCPPPCDPMADPSCPTPPPPCTDPNDPTTCKDPCMDDPAQCGCGAGGPANGSGGTDPGGCWPPPCNGPDCGPDGGTCHPNNPPPDFGCKDPSGA